MIKNSELPIGFSMELARNTDILDGFAKLTNDEQTKIVDGARQVTSKNEMRDYVQNMFQNSMK